jgi:hypothetical protein
VNDVNITVSPETASIWISEIQNSFACRKPRKTSSGSACKETPLLLLHPAGNQSTHVLNCILAAASPDCVLPRTKSTLERVMLAGLSEYNATEKFSSDASQEWACALLAAEAIRSSLLILAR